MILIRVGIKPV